MLFAVRNLIRSKPEQFQGVNIDYRFLLTTSFIIEPQGGRFSEVTAKSFNVSWSPPSNSGPIDKYRVKALTQGTSSAVSVACTYKSGLSAHCEGLQGNTAYKTTIEAWCDNYETAPAEYGAALTTNQQLTEIDSKFFSGVRI